MPTTPSEGGEDPEVIQADFWQRGIDELAVARIAQIQANRSAESLLTYQQELVAQQAVGGAEDAHSKVTALVPQARAAALKVRKYAFMAKQHREHVKTVLEEFRHIADDAAAEAQKAVLGWIAADAKETAERSTITDYDAKRSDKLADAVAAAAEPYHLAVLRNQKFCEVTYAKAKSAMSSCQKLVGDAKALALKAQTLQASGLPLDAEDSHTVANGMILQAEDLRKWAHTLYGQANVACSSTAGYTFAEKQAAINAAMTTAINAPMKLPKPQ